MPNLTGKMTLADYIKMLQSIPNPEQILAVEMRLDYGEYFFVEKKEPPKLIKLSLTKDEVDQFGLRREYEPNENGEGEYLAIAL